MSTVFVQFADSTNDVVTSLFAGPQDPTEHPNQGEIEDTDARYLAYVGSLTPAPSVVNGAERDNRLAVAALRIAPLQDAVDLDEATAEETASLKAWKTYRVAVNRVDLTLANPTWPDQPE